MCRWSDSAFPEPGEYVPQQIHLTPAGALPGPSAHHYTGVPRPQSAWACRLRGCRGFATCAAVSKAVHQQCGRCTPRLPLHREATPYHAVSVDHAPPSTIRAPDCVVSARSHRLHVGVHHVGHWTRHRDAAGSAVHERYRLQQGPGHRVQAKCGLPLQSFTHRQDLCLLCAGFRSDRATE